MRGPINLARQPFRNERLPTLLLGIGTLALVAATARQAAVAWDLLPGHARDVETELTSLEAEAARLRAESRSLRELTAPPETLGEWSAVKGLVDRRTFSWTGLLQALEQALPPGVRLVSISPSEAGNSTELAVAAVGRTSEDALELLRSLQQHEDFQGAFLNAWREGQDGVDITFTVSYAPGAGKRP